MFKEQQICPNHPRIICCLWHDGRSDSYIRYFKGPAPCCYSCLFILKNNQVIIWSRHPAPPDKVLAQLPVATGLAPHYKACCVFYQAVIKPLLWDFAIEDFELLMCIQYQSIMGHFSRSLSKLTLHCMHYPSDCKLTIDIPTRPRTDAVYQINWMSF